MLDKMLMCIFVIQNNQACLGLIHKWYTNSEQAIILGHTLMKRRMCHLCMKKLQKIQKYIFTFFKTINLAPKGLIHILMV